MLRKIILIAIAITFLTNCLIGQDRSNGLSELVHEGLGQGSDVRGTVYSVAINESTRQRPQEVVLTGLLPGKTNRVNFRLKNDCDDLVNFEKVTVSCGCMVVKQFNSTLAVGAESDFELEIRLGSGSGSERREIRFDAANGKVWSLRIVCQPVKIFVLNPKVFDVGMEDTHEVRFLKIDYDESAISSGLITENNGSVTCSAGGVMAQDVKVTKGETGVEIALTPDWVRFGLKRTVTEFLEIDHVNFRSSVSVEFRNKSLVRVSPASCSEVKLINGGQRFVLMKDQRVGELGFRGVLTDGVIFSINVAERISFNSGEIIELSCGDSEVLNCEKIEVFDLLNPDIVLSQIVVLRHKLMESLRK